MRSDVLLPLLVAVLPLAALAQGSRPSTRPSEETATVRFLAFDDRGVALGSPAIKVFESYDHKDLASTVRDGVAQGVPYGIYRVEGRLVGHFSDSRYIYVYQPNVTVVLGLEFGYELPAVPSLLRGHVTGLPSGSGGAVFARLLGIYSAESIESALAPDGSFSFAGVPVSGTFLLLIVGNGGILAQRTVRFYPTAPPALGEPETGSPPKIEIDPPR